MPIILVTNLQFVLTALTFKVPSLLVPPAVLLTLIKNDEPAAWDPSGPIRAALQERMWFLWQHRLAGPVLEMLARGKSARKAKTDSRRLGTC